MSKNAQVLLVNFTKAEADQVRKAGFGTDVGRSYPTSTGAHFFSPHPIHEYDIYVFNSERAGETREVPEPRIFVRQGDSFCRELCDLTSPPVIRIAFIGAVPSNQQELIGTTHISATKAHDNVSIIVPASSDGTQKIEPLHTLLERSLSQVRLPVQQYIAWSEAAAMHPYNFNPALVNRNGNILAAYSSSYGRSVPHYIALPQYKSNVLMLTRLLELFAEMEPNLFPDYSAADWIDGPEFWTPREQQIQSEIVTKQQEAELFISKKREQLVEASEEFAFIKGVLTALETSETPLNERLSQQVKLVLTYLGFEVTDIDKTITSAIRKEDLWVQDGEFLAICEINGTQKKNPKRTEYNDLLGRMNTIFKRRELVPDASNITGLLILNYDARSHPHKRPALYAGEDSDISKAASDSEIGILSTVELYKLARAVLFGTLTKEQARTQIKCFGLIKAHVDTKKEPPRPTLATPAKPRQTQ